MKCQDLFSLKRKRKKDYKMSSAAVVMVALRANGTLACQFMYPFVSVLQLVMSSWLVTEFLILCTDWEPVAQHSYTGMKILMALDTDFDLYM